MLYGASIYPSCIYMYNNIMFVYICVYILYIIICKIHNVYIYILHIDVDIYV